MHRLTAFARELGGDLTRYLQSLLRNTTVRAKATPVDQTTLTVSFVLVLEEIGRGRRRR
jgi:hypothetical protein